MKYKGCVWCKHFNFKKFGTCKAFPEGIPMQILSGDFEHTEVAREQKNKIVYEEIAEA